MYMKMSLETLNYSLLLVSFLFLNGHWNQSRCSIKIQKAGEEHIFVTHLDECLWLQQWLPHVAVQSGAAVGVSLTRFSLIPLCLALSLHTHTAGGGASLQYNEKITYPFNHHRCMEDTNNCRNEYYAAEDVRQHVTSPSTKQVQM